MFNFGVALLKLMEAAELAGLETGDVWFEDETPLKTDLRGSLEATELLLLGEATPLSFGCLRNGGREGKVSSRPCISSLDKGIVM